jgi:outer membrane protein OmpA-like peptidoglycan-associated protein
MQFLVKPKEIATAGRCIGYSYATDTAFMNMINTLSAPIASLRRLPALLLCLAGGPALAGVQHYQAPLDNVRWQTISKKHHCALSHDIPLYGRATFAQSAGEPLGFTLVVKHKTTREQDHARLRAIPPEWQHQTAVVDLGEVPVYKGATPFQIKAAMSRRILAELQKGLFPTFSYRDRVSVALPGIGIKTALAEFTDCLARLPIYKFTDFKDSLLHFELGKHTLRPNDRQRLDAVARYIKTDSEITRIEVNAHTDNIGHRRSNDKLSQHRAQAVKDYLMEQGIPPSKFKLKAFGERRPKYSNRTARDRAGNRRVRVTLMTTLNPSQKDIP